MVYAWRLKANPTLWRFLFVLVLLHVSQLWRGEGQQTGDLVGPHQSYASKRSLLHHKHRQGRMEVGLLG